MQLGPGLVHSRIDEAGVGYIFSPGWVGVNVGARRKLSVHSSSVMWLSAHRE